MRFLPRILMIISSLSIVSFLISEFGYTNIPILYPWGVFMHEYWFADYQERYKRHRGNFAIDGPPLVVSPGESGQIPWPYAAPGVKTSSQVPLQYTEQYYEVAHATSKYTPVDGVGGVVKSAIKPKQEPTTVKYCYPQAQTPGDYIANRFLGKGFSLGFSSLEEMGLPGKPMVEYNKNVFQDGTPFAMAEIKRGYPNDPRWATRPRYQSNLTGHQLMVPLTSAVAGDGFQNPQVSNVADQPRDYSGAEYTQDQVNQGLYGHTTLEYQSLANTTSSRPSWYKQSEDGEYIQKPAACAAWPGDLPDIGPQQNQYYNQNFITNTFTSHASAPMGTTGWGEPSSKENQVTGLSPEDMQRNYIASQLAQENPLPSFG